MILMGVILAVCGVWFAGSALTLILCSANGNAAANKMPRYRPKPRLVVDNTQQAA